MNWYEFKPTDTLFFKDASPMNKGEDHSAPSLFPPAAATIIGALRSAVLNQKGIAYKDYYAGKIDTAVLNAIGKAGEEAPFSLAGPLLKKDESLFVPTPYTWFVDKDKERSPVYVASFQSSPLIVMEKKKMLWVKGENAELENIGGRWVAIDKLNNPSLNDIKSSSCFYCDEIRTGIAMDVSRKVHEGHLYSFTHVRLQEDVSLVFGTSTALPLNKQGVLSLGGEKRFGAYREINIPKIPKERDGFFMTLTAVEAEESVQAALVAGGKLIYRGGWDLYKKFHKPMKTYYPAGSVFDKKISDNCIKI